MSYVDKLNEIIAMFELNQDNDEARDIVLLCRNVLEKSIDLIFDIKKVKKPVNASLLELINNADVRDFFGTDVIVDSLHFVRIVGINAFHGKHIKKTQAKVAYDNTKQLIDFLSKKLEITPKDSVVIPSDIVHTNDQGTIVSKSLSEYETRKVYIDTYLNEAGWEVVAPNTDTTLPNGTKVKCCSVIPGKACSEVMVEGLPTKTGIGFCDYVLYAKDGKPLAVIEAKRTSVDAHVGQQQVQEYGKCLKDKYGYIPVLYFTNGYDIYVIDGKYPPRKISGYHTLDELSYMIQKRKVESIKDMRVNDNIAGRPYQKMAITNICERFNDMHRKGLLVMATGTGKTRTAIALVDILTRNNWVKNVLFLADRTSLVRQAFKNFKNLLPNMTFAVLSDPSLADEPNARITFSTHQTMINYIDEDKKELSIGRFDLIIIDEAHRSIFNKYGAIFNYFDSMLVGLTATPKDEVDANTYAIFNCESGVPNYSYSMEEAIKDGYLVPYKLFSRTTKMMKDGVEYKDLSDEDKARLALMTEEHFEDDSIIGKNNLFRKFYNVDTCRKVLDDLMTLGLRVEQGQKLGKTIIFAVNHFHAQMIVDTFYEMYPMLIDYCKLIDNQIKNSDRLIEEFETDPNFRIAVSVDMLDTGIDVPSVLNLVFFKRVNSNIKLIQMIGRGTRLCPGLINGEDKKCFYIFDYFNNFSEKPLDVIKQPITIVQRLFGIKLEMMCIMQSGEHQVNSEHRAYYKQLNEELYLIVKRIKDNGSNRIGVRNNMAIIDEFYNKKKWEYISQLDQRKLTEIIMPLIESEVTEDYLVLSFDYRMYQIEKDLIENNVISKTVSTIKDIKMIANYLLNKASIDEIRVLIEVLQDIYIGDNWFSSITELENTRKKIRHLMKYLDDGPKVKGVKIDHFDVTEASDQDGRLIDIRTYKDKVIDHLIENSDNPTILKIKNLEPLTEEDFKYLEDILWVKLGSKEDYLSISKLDNIAAFIRTIVGLNQEAINEKFSEYLSGNLLTSEQQEFIYSIINYVRENGDVEAQVLIEESPFDHFDIFKLFGNNIPAVTKVVNTLHNCITLS